MTNFYSMQFLIFIVIALLCYYTVFRKKQWICLLLVSVGFYCWAGIENVTFLLITGVSTWLGACRIGKYTEALTIVRKNKALEKQEKEKQKKTLMLKRRIIMWGVVLVNFGVLACLKYIPKMIGHQVLGLLLPLGISFYTFQSIGYLLDVYNEKYTPEKNFARYMAFVAYFPQMIQGPINRYEALGEQLKKEHRWVSENVIKAIYRFFYGMMKKYAIANIFSVAIANIFDSPARDYAGATVVLGILLYSAQQYADFSGGIDMVLGVSELFDIRMSENFRQPYFSTSLADFWRRWHISLGKWMRDYVFYPFALTKPMKNLGKWANRRLGKHFGRVLPAALGNVLVFFVVGIWHGAEWHYVAWGLYNGIVIATSDMLAPIYLKITEFLKLDVKSVGYRLFQIIRTFMIVNIGWYFDRIYDVKNALYSLKKTLFDFNYGLLGQECGIVFDNYPNHAVPVAAVACIFVFTISLLEERNVNVRDTLYRKPFYVRWGVYLFVLGMIMISNTCVHTTGGFMYANF